MVSREPSSCALAPPDSAVEPAARLALEMRYALDPDRQVKKRNKALQVRFKDICEAQSERGQPPPGPGPQAEPRREPRPPPLRAAHRKYMTVPARRSIPNVTRSTGVQTSPDLRKCYQTFPLDRKRGSLKGLPAAEAFRGRAGGPATDARGQEEARPWGGGRVQTTAALVLRSDEQVDVLEPPAGLNCAERCRTPEGPSCLDAPRQPASRPASRGPGSQPPPGPDQGPEDTQEPALLAHGQLFKTELAAVYAPAPEPGLVGSAAASQWSLCLAADEEHGREAHLNGLQAAPGAAPACSPPAPCQPPEWNGQPAAARPPGGGEPANRASHGSGGLEGAAAGDGEPDQLQPGDHQGAPGRHPGAGEGRGPPGRVGTAPARAWGPGDRSPGSGPARGPARLPAAQSAALA